MTKEEKNQRLCEWLGYLKPTKDETEKALRERRYELRRWTLHRTSNAPIERFSSYYWTPPDFYSDEAANALLLEKMREFGNVTLHGANGWGVSTGYIREGGVAIWTGPSHSQDRKTAIAEAALLFILELQP